MSADVSLEGIRGILLDIEGTTTPIAYVHETLFNYAREHVRDYLTKHFDDLQDEIRLLREEHAIDVSKNKQPPLLNEKQLDSIVAYVNWLIDRDSKAKGLKSLEGKIWHEGYSDGTLQAQVFADVAPALARWRVADLSISIFSSGSVLAQQVLFAHTEAGDLTSFVNHYFDTEAGEKRQAASYRRIAESAGLQPHEMLFLSDITAELAAAAEAGMKIMLVLRPGNKPQDFADQYQSIQSFDELTVK